jgi:dipeptidyl-peptidase 4
MSTGWTSGFAVTILAMGVLAGAPAAPLHAQFPVERYQRAERFLSWNTQDLVYGAVASPEWVGAERFIYRTRDRHGTRWMLVDARTGAQREAFDHPAVARALGVAADTVFEGGHLPFGRFDFVQEGRAIRFDLRGQRWTCDLDVYRCILPERIGGAERDGVVSPDGRRVAFIRDHDLWVLERETGEERRLTTDGAPRYGYATDSQGWRRTDRPVLVWAPDSRAVATYRLDERGVGDMVLWRTAEGRPELHVWPYALPGDTVVPRHERVVVHLDGPTVVRLQTPPDHQRTSSCCGLLRGDVWADVQWSADGGDLAFVSTSRDYATVTLRLADPRTGEVREVLSETDEPFFESTGAARGVPNWRVLQGREEVIWYSWRDGWGHLYRYDLATGRLRNRVTQGEWSVHDLLHVDERGGWIYFTASGREPGQDPYFRNLYRVRLDGGGLQRLTPEDADHEVILSPDGRYFVDSYSRRDQAPVTVLRRGDGRAVATLATADLSDLLATGWRMPEPFSALARDGETALHGLLLLPSDFDPGRSYPVVVSIYPGPQVGSVGTRSFTTVARGQAHAMAELDFVVVLLDALGTPGRSRAFHTAYYGDLADNGLPDHITVLRQLAADRPWMDLSRVGIYGHSGGGFATAAALLRHPDFFHVGVASAGNMDNAGYTYYWGEKWHGPLVRSLEGHTYENQALHRFADGLEGKLLISYGTMDTNVHPNTTLLLVDALVAANRDFDLMVFPNRGHGYANEPYNVRITWDYFVRHLLGEEPPPGYIIQP